MEIKGKVHCFFEQSGTFKNEFIKLGIPAEDYDIQNNFGETDHTDDLFKAIEDAYDGKPSLFDQIRGGQDGDLIMAFFPCIYFTGSTNPRYYTLENMNYQKMTTAQKIDAMLQRSKSRQYFFELIIKLVGVCLDRGFRIIIENPYSKLHYLCNLRELGLWAYVMIYDKKHCDPIYKQLSRWVNNRFVFAKCERFEDYTRKKTETENDPTLWD